MVRQGLPSLKASLAAFTAMSTSALSPSATLAITLFSNVELVAMNNCLTDQNLSSGGVQGLKGLARDGVNELVVDEQPRVLYFWLDDWLRYSGHGARML